MKLKNILTGAAVGLALTASSGAFARDRDHDYRGDRSWGERHDCDGYRDNRGFCRHEAREERRDARWYRMNHRARIDRYVVYRNIRAHGYRYIGEPYWYGDEYVVRAYDPHGRIVFVRIDPYSGGWLGFSFRL